MSIFLQVMIRLPILGRKTVGAEKTSGGKEVDIDPANPGGTGLLGAASPNLGRRYASCQLSGAKANAMCMRERERETAMQREIFVGKSEGGGGASPDV